MQKSSDEPEGKRPPKSNKTLPLSAAWEKAAEELIERKGKLPRADHFAGKVFRKQFFPIIARVYFDDLLTQTRLTHPIDEISIVDDLKLDKGTLTKWLQGTHPPGADKFFAVVLLVLKADLNSIRFSDRSELLIRAMLRQLDRLAGDYCDTPDCAMDRFVLRSLIHAMRDPASDRFVPGSNVDSTIKEIALSILVNRVNDGLLQDFESSRQRNPKTAKPLPVKPGQLSLWLSSWGMAYTLLAIGTKNVSWEMDDV